jgi:DnaJ-class molecular chaperone
MSVVNWLERDRWSRPAWSGDSGSERKPLAARFERSAGELVLVVWVRPEEAEHGAMIVVPAPGQSVRLRIPPGTLSGRLFPLPRTNAPAPDGFGDLLVRVEVSAG